MNNGSNADFRQTANALRSPTTVLEFDQRAVRAARAAHQRDEMVEHMDDSGDVRFRFDREQPQRKTLVRMRARDFEDDSSSFADACERTPQYLRRLERRPLFNDELDYEVEKERAEAIVEQPREVAEQFARDLRNPALLRAIVKPPIVRTHAPQSEPVGGETDGGGTATSDSEVDDVEMDNTAPANDFFASLPTYDGRNVALADARLRAAFRDVPEIDDDEQLVLQNENYFDPRADLTYAQPLAEPAPAAASTSTHSAAFDQLPLLTSEQCSALFGSGLFSGIASRAERTALMQMPAVSATYATLAAHLFATRASGVALRHCNVVELIREMSLRGAKYDGCAMARAPTKMLLGDQETCRCARSVVGADQLRVCILKFHLVHANADNAAALNGGRGPQRNEEGDAANALDDTLQFNLAGFYDIDEGNGDGAREDDAADAQSVKYGTMHDIVRLNKVFMLCLRVACVMLDEAQAEHAGHIDQLVERIEAQPIGTAPLPPEYQQSVVECSDADDDDQTLIIRGENAAADSTHVLPSFSAAHSDASAEMASDRGEIMLDPRFDVDSPFLQRERDTMPGNQLMYTTLECDQIVGKPRSETFAQHVLQNHFGELCVRAFAYYMPSAEL